MTSNGVTNKGIQPLPTLVITFWIWYLVCDDKDGQAHKNIISLGNQIVKEILMEGNSINDRADTVYTDDTLAYDEYKWTVHKAILSTRSTLFKDIFNKAD